MKITFERATAADAEALVKVEVRAFHADAQLYPGIEIGGPPGYNSVEWTLKNMQQGDYYKIVCDGQLVGGFIVFDLGEGHLHLGRIYLDPDYHNRGIGAQAMQFAEDTYPAHKWSLDTPAWAVRNHHFYEKLGYVKVREETIPGITLFFYEKRLA